MTPSQAVIFVATTCAIFIFTLAYIKFSSIKSWWKGWFGPGKPIDTFYDDSTPKAVKPTLPPDFVRGETKTEDERLFWLEQELGRFRSQFDLFHPLKSELQELRGLVAKLSDEVSTFKASKQGDDAARNHRIGVMETDLNKRERQLDSLSIELSSVIESTKKFQSTLEHILKTRVSEENFAPLKQTVGRHDTEINVLHGQVKNLTSKVNAGVPLEVARLTETLNELKRNYSGTRSIVDSLQGARFDTQTAIMNRLTALEQARTNDAKLFDAAKQSADIKSVAGFEAREAVKGLIEAAKSELSDIILKKFATDVQEVFDRRYLKIENTTSTPVKRNRRRTLDAADAEAKSVQVFIDKAKAQNKQVLSKRK